MEIEDLIECIEAATVKMEVLRQVDYSDPSPEWVEFVDPKKLIEALRERAPNAATQGPMFWRKNLDGTFTYYDDPESLPPEVEPVARVGAVVFGQLPAMGMEYSPDDGKTWHEAPDGKIQVQPGMKYLVRGD